MPDIRLGQLDMDPREKKGPLLLKYNSVTALPIAEYLLPVSFDKEGILGSLFVSYRTLRVNWVDDLTFFRIIMWASTGAWEEVMNDCCWGSSSPKDCITTNSWLHSCQRGKKMYEWTVFSRFSFKQVWFWHKWPFWGKSYFKVLQVSRGDLLHLRHSMYCTMICLRHRKSNHFNFRWCKKYSGVKGDRFTHGYLPSSVLHEFGLCSPICQIFSPDWVLFFYPHASHHSMNMVC